VGRVGLAEPLLRLLLGLHIAPRIQLDGGLTDLARLPVVAKHILDEAGDVARHGGPLSRAGRACATRAIAVAAQVEVQDAFVPDGWRHLRDT
jgi:hypothetical protein